MPPKVVNPDSLIMKRLIQIRRVAKTTGGGKKRSIYAIVVVGDRNGSAGYGEGRALDAANAVQKATRDALKNMSFIERLDNRTVFSNIDHTFHHTTLKIKSCSAGYGVVANKHIHEICMCAGIHDLYAKIRGSTNPMNVVKATFEALKSQRSPTEIARFRGTRAQDVIMTYFGQESLSK